MLFPKILSKTELISLEIKFEEEVRQIPTIQDLLDNLDTALSKVANDKGEISSAPKEDDIYYIAYQARILIKEWHTSLLKAIQEGDSQGSTIPSAIPTTLKLLRILTTDNRIQSEPSRFVLFGVMKMIKGFLELCTFNHLMLPTDPSSAGSYSTVHYPLSVGIGEIRKEFDKIEARVKNLPPLSDKEQHLMSLEAQAQFDARCCKALLCLWEPTIWPLIKKHLGPRASFSGLTPTVSSGDLLTLLRGLFNTAKTIDIPNWYIDLFLLKRLSPQFCRNPIELSRMQDIIESFTSWTPEFAFGVTEFLVDVIQAVPECRGEVIQGGYVSEGKYKGSLSSVLGNIEDERLKTLAYTTLLRVMDDNASTLDLIPGLSPDDVAIIRSSAKVITWHKDAPPEQRHQEEATLLLEGDKAFIQGLHDKFTRNLDGAQEATAESLQQITTALETILRKLDHPQLMHMSTSEEGAAGQSAQGGSFSDRSSAMSVFRAPTSSSQMVLATQNAGYPRLSQELSVAQVEESNQAAFAYFREIGTYNARREILEVSMFSLRDFEEIRFVERLDESLLTHPKALEMIQQIITAKASLLEHKLDHETEVGLKMLKKQHLAVLRQFVEEKRKMQSDRAARIDSDEADEEETACLMAEITGDAAPTRQSESLKGEDSEKK